MSPQCGHCFHPSALPPSRPPPVVDATFSHYGMCGSCILRKTLLYIHAPKSLFFFLNPCPLESWTTNLIP